MLNKKVREIRTKRKFKVGGFKPASKDLPITHLFIDGEWKDAISFELMPQWWKFWAKPKPITEIRSTL